MLPIRHRSIRLWLIAAGLIGLAVTGPTAGTVLNLNRVAGSERWTAASGPGTGHWDATRSTASLATFKLVFYERSDEAVRIESSMRTISTDTGTDNYGGPFVEAVSGGGSSQVLSLDTGFITAIQICTNSDKQPKLKGARIWGGRVGEDGHITQTNESPKFERPNCKHWQPKVSCGANKIAVGFRAYFYDAHQKGFSGMALQCAAVEP